MSFPSAALRAASPDFAAAPGFTPNLGEAVADCLFHDREEYFRFAASQLSGALAAGARIISLWDDAYPPLLTAIYDPPPLLFVRGDPGLLAARSIALVGTRRASSYGLDAAGRLAREASGAGLVVVSGLARGIDTEAHREALLAGGKTIAQKNGASTWGN